MDITITEELRKEGIARELVNRIQNIRKSSGFDITDKVNVVIASNEATDAAVEEYKDYMANQVLANSIEIAPVMTDGIELDLDDLKLMIQVQKA